MSTLFGPKGEPISSSMFKKADPPKTGEAFGTWAGQNDNLYLNLPGGGALQFNLDNLTLTDYRNMTDHYQVNASLAVLTFMLHQMDWQIECDNKKIADHATANMLTIWTRLVRALSQSFWAGYSPNVLQWENRANGEPFLDLTKVKDLRPEDCAVHWKDVEGWAPPGRVKPKLKVYDGIDQLGSPYTIPVENSLWYPLLMQNGNHYGRKLLRPAYVPYFFSQLMHLFSNRYFERFGEPVPIGRAPYDDEIEVPGAGDAPGKMVKGPALMSQILQNLRSRSTVVMPSGKQLDGDGNPTQYYEYAIEYLESQMRGADFERYLMRLDEEISLALFTPLLVIRTADVGSYNLGVGHMAIYLNMLNAIAGDMKEYIDKYVLWPMAKYNFSEKAPRPTIKFRKLGKENVDTMRAVLQALLQNGTAAPDLDELSQIVGLTLKEKQALTEPQPDPNVTPDEPAGTPAKQDAAQAKATAQAVKARIASQVEAAFKKNDFGSNFTPSLGFKRRMEAALEADGIADAPRVVESLYGRLDSWMATVVPFGQEEFTTPESFTGLFNKVLDTELESVTNGS